MSVVWELLGGGWDTTREYLLAHLPFVIPAFFLAGALYALFPREKILRYLGPDSPRYQAYPMAVAGGLCLAVCSCTILPLFAGIRKSGAGLGPAIVFLYTAPATNILAVIYTSRLIGWDVALARILLSIAFAVIIGITMSFIFPEQAGEGGPGEASPGAFAALQDEKTSAWLWAFFAVLLAILLWGASPILKLVVKLPPGGAPGLAGRRGPPGPGQGPFPELDAGDLVLRAHHPPAAAGGRLRRRNAEGGRPLRVCGEVLRQLHPGRHPGRGALRGGRLLPHPGGSAHGAALFGPRRGHGAAGGLPSG